MEPVIFGTVGLGNYAGGACRLLEADATRSDAAVRLAAVCEPDPRLHADRIAELRGRGVSVLERYEDLLQQDIEALWLPLPIALHRPFTEQALAAGKAVLCEKPAAGSVQDVDAMIRARDRVGGTVCIGFQDAYLPQAMRMKRLLRDGAIGRIESATLIACWPRGDRYYGRSRWAGAVAQGDTWVLDSPAGNAVAHYIHLGLFLLGGTPESAAEPAAVEAELYRARPIENYDTASLRVTLADGTPFLILLTHACAEQVDTRLEFQGTAGQAAFLPERECRVTAADGSVRMHEACPDARAEMVRRFARQVRGEPSEAGVATLETARAHVVVVNGASEASAVLDVPEDAVRHATSIYQDQVRAIAGIEAAMEACAVRRQMLHESGQVTWSRPAGRCDVRGYRLFRGPRE